MDELRRAMWVVVSIFAVMVLVAMFVGARGERLAMDMSDVIVDVAELVD